MIRGRGLLNFKQKPKTPANNKQEDVTAQSIQDVKALESAIGSNQVDGKVDEKVEQKTAAPKKQPVIPSVYRAFDKLYKGTNRFDDEDSADNVDQSNQSNQSKKVEKDLSQVKSNDGFGTGGFDKIPEQSGNNNVQSKPDFDRNKKAGPRATTGANNAPLGRRVQKQPRDTDSEAPNSVELNKMLSAGAGYSEKNPYKNEKHGYLPKDRLAEEISKDDVDRKDLYAHAYEKDEKITTECPGASETVCINDWSEFALNEVLKENILRCGYVRPRKIQAYAIPLIIDGFDLKVQAETSSGKTLAYLIPIIQKIIEENKKEGRKPFECHAPSAIVIAPTRELVIQIYENAVKLTRDTGVRASRAYGEYDHVANAKHIMEGSDIVIGTPGRLVKFFNDGIISLGRLKYLCLDEADRLLDKSFKEDFDKMVRNECFPSKENVQTLLFSATYPEHSEAWIDVVLKERHAKVFNERANKPNLQIEHSFENCPGNKKTMRLLQFCNEIIDKYQEKEGRDEADLPRILIFVNECHKADVYAFYLNANGINALSLNSHRDQKTREEFLTQFRRKQVAVIVATDVCARGLDIKGVDYVINADLSKEFEMYVQRVGRTGRLEKGCAHSFFDSTEDVEILPNLVNALSSEEVNLPQFLIDALGQPSELNSVLNVPAPPTGFD